jgi:hypothetical protein
VWLPYHQVVDLNLLDAYLEALGIDEISELIAGKGKPPSEDPQMFLGYLKLLELQHGYNNAEPSTPPRSYSFNLPSHISSISSLALLSTHLSPSATMSHPAPHAATRSTTFKCLCKVDATTYALCVNNAEFSIHALQLRDYIVYDQQIRDGQISPLREPFGFYNFVDMFNRCNNTAHHFATWSEGSYNEKGEKVNKGWLPNGPPITTAVLPFDFFDPQLPIKHQELMTLGVVTPSGRLDQHGIRRCHEALHAGTDQKIRQMDAKNHCLDKKQAKKRKFNESNTETIDYTVPIPMHDPAALSTTVSRTASILDTPHERASSPAPSMPNDAAMTS